MPPDRESYLAKLHTQLTYLFPTVTSTSPAGQAGKLVGDGENKIVTYSALKLRLTWGLAQAKLGKNILLPPFKKKYNGMEIDL